MRSSNNVGLEVNLFLGKSVTQGVRGTRDFYPEDMRLRNWLFDNFTDAALLHGFDEYDENGCWQGKLSVKAVEPEMEVEATNYNPETEWL